MAGSFLARYLPCVLFPGLHTETWCAERAVEKGEGASVLWIIVGSLCFPLARYSREISAGEGGVPAPLPCPCAEQSSSDLPPELKGGEGAV